MESSVRKKGLLSNIFTHTFETLKHYPLIYVPFTIFVTVELTALTFLYYIPRVPLRELFGPPVRTFWGEKFLHYPYNFLLLPKLSYYSRMFLSIILGSLLLGMAVALINDIYYKKPLRLLKALKIALKKYISLFTVALIITALYFLLERTLAFGVIKYFLSGHKKLLFIRANIWVGPLLSVLSFFTAITVQSVFAYCVPALIIGNEKLLKAIMKSFLLYVKYFIPTLIIVGLPMCAFIPILILTYNSTFLINKLFPEFILYILIFGAIVNSLVLDLLITASTTYCYLETVRPKNIEASQNLKNTKEGIKGSKK